jgi:hypothetical protein
MIKYDKILISSSLLLWNLIKINFLSYFIAVFIWKISQRNLDVKAASHAAFLSFAGGEVHKKKMWRIGRALESKSEWEGSRPGGVSFETFQLCRRSSTLLKGCQKSSIFLVKFSSGMSETFFDTCVNWSCVTRCGCRTTSSTLFTVYPYFYELIDNFLSKKFYNSLRIGPNFFLQHFRTQNFVNFVAT